MIAGSAIAIANMIGVDKVVILTCSKLLSNRDAADFAPYYAISNLTDKISYTCTLPESPASKTVYLVDEADYLIFEKPTALRSLVY